MSQKEVQINRKWYWELEQKDEIQVFMGQTNAFFSDDNISYYEGKLVCCFKKGVIDESPFMNDWGQNYKFCALQSSKHEKKSRRATNIEVMKWCSTNGVWLDEYNQVRNDPLDANLSELKNPCKECVVKVVKWDGEPMEPTAQNMGLEE